LLTAAALIFARRDTQSMEALLASEVLAEI
jgi:hypothetical protein